MQLHSCSLVMKVVFKMPSRLKLLFFKEGTLVALPTCMESTDRLPWRFGN